MASEDLFAAVASIIRQAFGAQDAEITRETGAFDVDGWDSLSHATLMVMIERRFHIDITEDESNELADVSDLIDLIASKL